MAADNNNVPLEIGVLLLDVVQFYDIAPVDLLGMISTEYAEALGSAGGSIQHMGVPMNIHYIGEQEPGTLSPTSAKASIALTHSIATAPELSILIVPGPPLSYVAAPAVKSFIRRAHERGAAIISICTGVLPLAQSGILDGRVATAPLIVLPMLRERFPSVRWENERRWEKSVRDGREVWTSGTIANGIDLMCAFMRERFVGRLPLVEGMIALASVPERDVVYSEKQREMEQFLVGAQGQGK